MQIAVITKPLHVLHACNSTLAISSSIEGLQFMYGKGCTAHIKPFANKCNDDSTRVATYIMLYHLRYYLFL